MTRSFPVKSSDTILAVPVPGNAVFKNGVAGLLVIPLDREVSAGTHRGRTKSLEQVGRHMENLNVIRSLRAKIRINKQQPFKRLTESNEGS